MHVNILKVSAYSEDIFFKKWILFLDANCFLKLRLLFEESFLPFIISKLLSNLSSKFHKFEAKDDFFAFFFEFFFKCTALKEHPIP